MEKRKLVFNEDVKLRERKRVRNFTIYTIIIGLILCVLVIPLLELKSYKNDKDISKNYIKTVKHIWYDGINNIEYNELIINVLDTDIEYESIYTEGICLVYDKIQVTLYIEDIIIIQNMNNITINTQGGRELITLKFITDEKKEVITENKIVYWLFEMFFTMFYIFLAYIIITLYKSAENKRMIIDMKKH